MEERYHVINKVEKKPEAAQSPLDDYKCSKCGKEWKGLTQEQLWRTDLNGCPL